MRSFTQDYDALNGMGAGAGDGKPRIGFGDRRVASSVGHLTCARACHRDDGSPTSPGGVAGQERGTICQTERTGGLGGGLLPDGEEDTAATGLLGRLAPPRHAGLHLAGAPPPSFRRVALRRAHLLRRKVLPMHQASW